MESFQVATSNVGGISNAKKRREVFNFLHQKKFTIVCLQETHSTMLSEALWRMEWGGEIVFSHGESNARGTAILIRPKANIIVHRSSIDVAGRCVVSLVEINKVKYTIANFCAPNVDLPHFFEFGL